MRALFTFILLFLLTCRGIAQTADSIHAKPDTLLLNNGKIIIAHIIDTSGYTVDVIKNHGREKIEVDKSDIFQITYGNSGKQVIIYIYDSLVNDQFTIPEARIFIAGEQDARRGFPALGASIAGFVIGAGAAIISPVLAIPTPLLFAGIEYKHQYVKINHKSVRNMDNVTHDSYLRGYALGARQKRLRRALIWGGVGAVVGTVLHFTLFKSL